MMIPEETLPSSAAKRKSGDDATEESPGERKKRASHACDSCRVKKVKCNEERPCTNCVRQNLACRYAGNPILDLEIEIIKRRLAELEGRSEIIPSQNPPRLPSPASVTSNRPSYVLPIDLPGTAQSTTRPQRMNINVSAAEPDPGSEESESLIDVNKDTLGVEYYGGSSSVAILQRLYTRARRQSSSNPREIHQQLPTTGPSIVNLLHNPDFQGIKNGPPNAPVSYLLIEAAFLNVFFDTLHYMHPIIDKTTFLQRCAQPSEIHGPLGAVYYACLALSAITTAENDAKLGEYSPIQWANLYVDSAKRALGDYFSVTTLETVQALFLLSTVAQNALRQHDCYMYLGAALRSAEGIGMHQHSDRATDQRGRQRTWWAIYNLEAELCCASGRPDSLPKEEHISIALPDLRYESPEASMINVMVPYARLARQVSSRIYLEKRSLSDKLTAAKDFDRILCEWHESYPKNLHNDPNPLRQPDYVARQKIVLELRFHNLRLLMHQPVLFLPLGDSAEYHWHIEKCVTAASTTIHCLHEDFVSRYYFRSWWYNSTYALFATMVLLYCVLRDPHQDSITAICADIEMGIEVFQAMGTHRVAKRCLELVSSVYDLAQKIIQNGVTEQNPVVCLEADNILPNLIDPFLLEDFALHVGDGNPSSWSADFGMEQPSGALETFLQFMANKAEDGKWQSTENENVF